MSYTGHRKRDYQCCENSKCKNAGDTHALDCANTVIKIQPGFWYLVVIAIFFD